MVAFYIKWLLEQEQFFHIALWSCDILGMKLLWNLYFVESLDPLRRMMLVCQLEKCWWEREMWWCECSAKKLWYIFVTLCPRGSCTTVTSFLKLDSNVKPKVVLIYTSMLFLAIFSLKSFQLTTTSCYYFNQVQ